MGRNAAISLSFLKAGGIRAVARYRLSERFQVVQQSFGPGRSSSTEIADTGASTISRSEDIAMTHEVERVGRMFVSAPEADTLKCSFVREQASGSPSRIEVEIKREGDGSVSITSTHRRTDGLRSDEERQPERLMTLRIAIGADGNLVRAIVDNHRAGEIQDKGTSYADAYGAVGQCHLDEVERYATGRQRGRDAELTFERSAERVKKLDVDI